MIYHNVCEIHPIFDLSVLCAVIISLKSINVFDLKTHFKLLHISSFILNSVPIFLLAFSEVSSTTFSTCS